MDVAAQFPTPVVKVHHHRFESPLENVPAAPMTPIEPHAVTHPENMHAGTHPALPAHPQKQVIIVPHQHVGVHLETEPSLQFGKNLEEIPPVTVVAENILFRLLPRAVT